MSSNPSVATVTTGGVVRALGSGRAEIRGQYQGLSGAFPLDVISGADITDIILAGASLQVFLGQPLALAPRIVIRGSTVYDLDANRAVWSTSDARVVAVAADGTMATVSAGIADITATFLGKTASTRVIVSVLDHDTFTIASESAAGLFAVGGRLSFAVTVAYSLVSAPAARVGLQILDQNGRSLGSNPTVDVTGGLFKTATSTDEITVLAGASSICTAATMNVSSGQQLRASGGCLMIR